MPSRRDGHAHRAAFGQPGDAVLDGVLHQGLQQQGRDGSARVARVDLPGHLEAAAEADLLDGEVGLEQVHLLGQVTMRFSPRRRLPRRKSESRTHMVRAPSRGRWWSAR